MTTETELQQKGISGTVTDAITGEAMVGVNIQVKGTTIGTLSDVKGNYSIPSSIDQNAILVFSFVGYVTQEIPVSGKTVINIALASDVTGLNEVVVIGYGSSKKASLTGSISEVKGDVIQRAPEINFTNTLAGQIPGLVAVNTSGEPGKDAATINIRGLNTLGDNSALVVVDGIAGRDMSYLDPSEVESITVLKDASAAIYGARAANGVILITTKRGNIGKPLITFNVDYGISMPTMLPKMCDAATYATMINEVDSYEGRPSSYTADAIQKYKDGSDPWKYPNSDYFKAVFKPSTPQNDAKLSLSGGTERIKYFISGGFKYQDDIYRNSSSNYKQADFRANIDSKISDNISLSLDLAGRQQNGDYPAFTLDKIFSSIIAGGAGSGGLPTRLLYFPGNLPNADFINGNNPVVMATSLPGYDDQIGYGFTSNAKLNITIPWVKGLSVAFNASFDKDFNNEKLWQTPYTLYSWDGQTYNANNEPVVVPALMGASLDAQLTQTMSEDQGITLNTMVNYDISIADKHHIKILGGVEKITGESSNLMAYRRGFVSTAIDEMFAGADQNKDNSGSASQSARLDYFGRLDYDYLQKYLFEFVWRYDGSYIFPAKGRFGFFPGVSAGWKISDEDFWKNSLSFINYFKLRGSWGQTGNDRIAGYQYLSSYGFSDKPYVFNSNYEVKALNELVIANPNVTWEIANQSNIGFDGQLLGGKVQFTAEYFYNLRTHILCQRNASVPASTGLILPLENIGKVSNQGFEVQLGYKNKIGNLNYEVSGNISHAENKILFWDETPGIPDYQRSTGQPMNAGLYYEAIGIFKDQAAVDAYPHWVGAQPGDIIFKDVNGDGKIDGLDMVRDPKTGTPTWTGGVSINLGYKNFYAYMLFQGAAGAIRTYTIESGRVGNYLEYDADGRWTVDNTNATKPRTWNAGDEYWSSSATGGPANTDINNTYWLLNNDYVRLKNIQIGYNVPKTITDKLKISGLSIYFSGENIFTISHEKIFDPETVGNTYPLNKVYNFGIKLAL